MSWHLLVIHSLTYLLLTLYSDFKPKELTEPLMLGQLNNLELVFDKRSSASLIAAFVTGNKEGLPKKIKNRYRALCLYHLFTPSGIHLSAVYLLILPLLRLLKRKYSIPLSLILCFLIFLLPGCYSLKRISALRIFRIIIPRKVALIWIFYLVFLGDFLIGSFDSSPLSHIFSFLFLGTILSTNDHRVLPINLYFAQLLILHFMGGTLSLLAPIFGFILTTIFTPFFLIFLVTFIIPLNFLEFFVTSYDWIVSIFYEMSNFLPHFYPSIPLLIILPIFILPLKRWYKISLTLLMILLHSPPAINLPHHNRVPSHYKSPWFWIDKSRIVRHVYTVKGYRITYGSGYRCYYHHYNWFYKENCY